MRVVIARSALPAWLVAASACSDAPARVRLAPVRPVADSVCGDRRPDPTELVVIAYAPGGEVLRTVPVDAAVAVADFPEDTEQLGVEARIGGAPVAIGKTAPLAFDALADGATIPIFMAPPDGFCPLAPMRAARRAPLVARASDGVLIVGGVDAAGTPLTTAERYDPTTGTFTEVAVPEILGQNGFVGATLTALPDGRVVLAGGPQPVATIYNPERHAFGESVLIESRAFHAALAVDTDELLLIGGCSSVEAGGCGGVVRLGSKLYEATAADTVREIMPSTTLRAGRLGAAIVDIGPQLDGKRAFVIAGGAPPPSGPPDAADRFSLGDSDATQIAGSLAVATVLDGGGVLTAFAGDADPPSGLARVFAPGANTAQPIALAPERAGARLATLENGRVVAIGGDPAGDVLHYDPLLDAWERVDAGAPQTTAPVLHRLDDGSVLVLGGSPAVDQAWIYRPPLLGPASGRVTVVTTGPSRANVLTAPDPATVTRNGEWVLATGSEPRARALVGGPRMTSGAVRAVVRVKAGGAGVIAQATGPGRALVGELVPGAAARIVLLEDGAESTLCRGDPVAAFDPAVAVTIELAVADDRARLLRDGDELAACTVTGVRGAWGVAAIGSGSEVAVDTVALTR